eukprot:gene34400-57159_t
MTRLVFDHLTNWITAAASEHSLDLAAHIEERTGASRRATLSALKRLVEAGWLARSGTSRRPVFSPGALRQVARSYTLHGLQEDLPWQRDFAPHFALPKHVERMVQHVRQHCGAEPACYMTGGAGWKMAPVMNGHFELVESLIMDGLLVIAQAR